MRLYSAKAYTICTIDGELIAVVTLEQRNRLLGLTEEGKAPHYGAPCPPLFPDGEPIFNTKLITIHRKKRNIYYALVDASVIRAELTREFTNAVPVAEDCRTIRRIQEATATGCSVRYFEHHEPHCFAYLTTEASAADRVYRHFLREKRSAHLIQTVCTGLKSDFFPLRATDNVVTIPVRTESELPEAA